MTGNYQSETLFGNSSAALVSVPVEDKDLRLLLVGTLLPFALL